MQKVAVDEPPLRRTVVDQLRQSRRGLVEGADAGRGLDERRAPAVGPIIGDGDIEQECRPPVERRVPVGIPPSVT